MIDRRRQEGKARVRFDIGALKSARTGAGWTQDQLVRYSGWSVSTIQRAEAGAAVSIRAAMAIWEALNTRFGEKIVLGDLLKKEDASSVFLTPGGDRFEKKNGLWIEYKNGKEFATFDEFDRDESYIYIACRKRKGAGGRRMYVRIPMEGGDVQWTWENPLNWEAFARVVPEK